MKFTREQTLAFVEQGEFLRERARIECRHILGEADIQECFDDPAQASQHILDAVVAALMGVIVWDAVTAAQRHAAELGLPEISNAEAAPVVEDAIQQLEETEPDVENALRDSDERLRADGQFEAVILAVLASDAGRDALLSPVQGILTGAAAGVVTAVEQGIFDLAQAKHDEKTPDALFRWYATGDGRECAADLVNSCEPRDGMEKTLEEWRALGLPGAGNLLCSIYSKSGLPQCRCQLGPADVRRAEPGVVDVTDAVKAGRERARQ